MTGTSVALRERDEEAGGDLTVEETAAFGKAEPRGSFHGARLANVVEDLGDGTGDGNAEARLKFRRLETFEKAQAQR
jgi:hypothetical protein